MTIDFSLRNPSKYLYLIDFCGFMYVTSLKEFIFMKWFSYLCMKRYSVVYWYMYLRSLSARELYQYNNCNLEYTLKITRSKIKWFAINFLSVWEKNRMIKESNYIWTSVHVRKFSCSIRYDFYQNFIVPSDRSHSEIYREIFVQNIPSFCPPRIVARFLSFNV